MVEEESKSSSNIWSWIITVAGAIIILFAIIYIYLLITTGTIFDVLSELSWFSSFGKSNYNIRSAFDIVK